MFILGINFVAQRIYANGSVQSTRININEPELLSGRFGNGAFARAAGSVDCNVKYLFLAIVILLFLLKAKD